VRDRRNHRQVSRSQLTGKNVLFEDFRVAPAGRPVKFRDDRDVIFDANLVNPVLVTVKCEKSTVAAISNALECRDYLLGLKIGIGNRRRIILLEHVHLW
jgi:hypothetical protein